MDLYKNMQLLGQISRILTQKYEFCKCYFIEKGKGIEYFASVVFAFIELS